MSFSQILIIVLIVGLWMLAIEVIKIVIALKFMKSGVNQIVKQSTDAAVSGVFKAFMKYKLDKENARAVWPEKHYTKGEFDDEMSDM